MGRGPGPHVTWLHTLTGSSWHSCLTGFSTGPGGPGEVMGKLRQREATPLLAGAVGGWTQPTDPHTDLFLLCSLDWRQGCPQRCVRVCVCVCKRAAHSGVCMCVCVRKGCPTAVCVCVRVCVCACMPVCLCPYVCFHVCECVCVNACAHVFAHACMGVFPWFYVCMPACLCLGLHTCWSLCALVCTCACVCVCVSVPLPGSVCTAVFSHVFGMLCR